MFIYNKKLCLIFFGKVPQKYSNSATNLQPSKYLRVKNDIYLFIFNNFIIPMAIFQTS